MGREAQVSARFDGKECDGKVFLETDEVVLRGGVRVRIPYRDMKKVRASDGTLVIDSKQGRLELDLGTKAAADWAHRINNPKTRADKLGIKAGHKVVLVKIDDDAFASEIESKGATISRRAVKDADALFLQARKPADLGEMTRLKGYLKQDGALWLLRQKGGEIKESDSMAAGRAAGLVDVKVVRFPDALTAEKYVIPVKDRSG